MQIMRPCVHHSINQHVTISSSITTSRICTQIPQTQQAKFLGFTIWSKGTQNKVSHFTSNHSIIQRSTLRSAKAVYFIVTTWNYKVMSNKQTVTKMKLHSTPFPPPVIICPITLPFCKSKSQKTNTVAALANSSLSYNFYSLSTPSKL